MMSTYKAVGHGGHGRGAGLTSKCLRLDLKNPASAEELLKDRGWRECNLSITGVTRFLAKQFSLFKSAIPHTHGIPWRGLGLHISPEEQEAASICA
jgi:hypothetical protein